MLAAVFLTLQLGLFDYDVREPLDVETGEAEVISGVRLGEISYRSPRGGRVSGYLVEPTRPVSRAGIVFVHWGQGNRSEFIAEAIVYAHAGASSLLIDAPHMRADFGGPDNGFLDPEGERETYAQLVIDSRRAFDVLLTREGVNGDRLGYVGHSLGATWGGALAGVEKRARAFVLMAGLPNLVERKSSYPEEMWQQIEQAFGAEAVDVYRETMSPLSPERFVGQAPSGSVFFQFARYDRFISDGAVAAFIAAAREPRVSRYHTGHEMNDLESLRDRARWLEDKLGLEPVLPLLRALLSP